MNIELFWCTLHCHGFGIWIVLIDAIWCQWALSNFQIHDILANDDPGNGFSPNRRQAIVWFDRQLLSIKYLKT